MVVNQNIQLICFDLGGVFIRIVSTWQEAFDRAGVTLDPQAVKNLNDHCGHDLIHAHETGVISSKAFCEKVAERYGMSYQQALSALDEWLIEPYALIDSLLDRIKAQQLATACLSNTCGRHFNIMMSPGKAQLPLARLDHHFTSHTIGAMKPAADIYAHVENRTGLPPQAIVFFDDREENIAAAIKRGWHGYVIDPCGETAKQMTGHLESLGVL